MTQRKKICIYCASSRDIGQIYFDAAERLGVLLAEKGIDCICGAGREGLMGRLTDSALSAGGKVIGVIPQFMVDRGWSHPHLSETVITPDIHIRKQTMARLSDAVIALPGGCGTLEELLEIITWKQLGLYSKPIIILNVDGYFNHLIAMLNHAVDQHFMKQSHRTLWHIANTAEEALYLLEQLPADEQEAESKYAK